MKALHPDLRRRYAKWAESTFGLAFPRARSDALDDAVHEAVRRSGIADPAELLRRAQAGEVEPQDVLSDTLTVGETYFFRDEPHFERLRRALERSTRPVLLWSAGCANGAEPYSMAIVAWEVFGADAPDRVRVLGSDLSMRALAEAKRGTYRPWSLRGLDEGRRARWFEPDGSKLQLRPEVRQMVRFGRINLLDPRDPGWPRDVAVIFCRNVLVYFGDEAIHRAAGGLHRALNLQGVLITGPADPLLSAYGFEIDLTGGFIAYRKVIRPQPPLRAPAPAHPWMLAPDSAPAAAPSRRRLPPAAGPAGPEEALAEVRALADRGDSAGALRAAMALTKAHPLLADAWLLLGLMRQVHGEHEEAVRAAKRALLLDRSLIQAHMILAPSLWALGDTAQARRALRNARLFLQALPPDTVIQGSGATAAEVLAASIELDRAIQGARHA